MRRTSQGICVARLHYTADPAKNPETEVGREWLDAAVKAYPGGISSLGWRREMEIDWSAGAGELVFPEFVERERELVIDPFDLDETFKVYGGLDWGNRNMVSFHVYAESMAQKFYSIWEYYVPGTETNVFEVAKVLKEECPYYERLEWIACDPTMWKEDQQREGLIDKTSIARMLIEEVPVRHRLDRLIPAQGRSDVAAIQKTRILLFNESEPKFQFFKTCPGQISEFRNLKYPPRRETQNETEKILDKDNHSWDEWKYVLLSHPTAKLIEEKPQFGTVGYYMQMANMASQIAAESGRDTQEVFNEIYGR